MNCVTSNIDPFESALRDINDFCHTYELHFVVLQYYNQENSCYLNKNLYVYILIFEAKNHIFNYLLVGTILYAAIVI